MSDFISCVAQTVVNLGDHVHRLTADAIADWTAGPVAERA
ncbi:hypothetical protein ABH995_000955 [Bradyrhizobium yuanmingense]